MSCDFNSNSPAWESESLTVGAGPETQTEFNIPRCKICGEKKRRICLSKNSNVHLLTRYLKDKIVIKQIEWKRQFGAASLLDFKKTDKPSLSSVFNQKFTLKFCNKKKWFPLCAIFDVCSKELDHCGFRRRETDQKLSKKMRAKTTNIKFHCASYCFCCVHLFFHTSAGLCG